jgi:hypothetical protein
VFLVSVSRRGSSVFGALFVLEPTSSGFASPSHRLVLIMLRHFRLMAVVLGFSIFANVILGLRQSPRPAAMARQCHAACRHDHQIVPALAR